MLDRSFREVSMGVVYGGKVLRYFLYIVSYEDCVSGVLKWSRSFKWGCGYISDEM